jgi:hypothetical protein
LTESPFLHRKLLVNGSRSFLEKKAIANVKDGDEVDFQNRGMARRGKRDRSYGVEGDEEKGYSAMVWANKRSGKSEQLDGGPFKTFELAVARCQEDEDVRA